MPPHVRPAPSPAVRQPPSIGANKICAAHDVKYRLSVRARFSNKGHDAAANTPPAAAVEAVVNRRPSWYENQPRPSLPHSDVNIPSPIFILGALRSGTTVLRLMLDSHKDISNPGEVNFIFDHLKKQPQSDKWVYDLQELRMDRTFQTYNLNLAESEDGKVIAKHFVDQFDQRAHGHLTLNIHRNLDRVAAIFPDAKIIHILRDPRDVARSCIGMGWAGNTYFGIDPWLGTENNWDAFASLFEKANVIEFRFEDLILNPQRQLEDICRFIGVSFSPEMLSYPDHSTYEAPGPSAIQQWKTKLSPRDVALVEIKAKSLLLDRNYQLSGYPLDRPGLLERLCLFWTNKAYKWKFASRRYGIFNVAMEKITRRFIKPLHPVFVQRINEMTKQYLK